MIPEFKKVPSNETLLLFYSFLSCIFNGEGNQAFGF